MQNLAYTEQEKNKLFNFFHHKKIDNKSESFLKSLIIVSATLIIAVALLYSVRFFDSSNYIKNINQIENKTEIIQNKKIDQLFSSLQKKSLTNIQLSLISITKSNSLSAHTKALDLILNYPVKVNNKYTPEYKAIISSYLLNINSINYELIELQELNYYKSKSFLTINHQILNDKFNYSYLKQEKNLIKINESYLKLTKNIDDEEMKIGLQNHWESLLKKTNQNLISLID